MIKVDKSSLHSSFRIILLFTYCHRLPSPAMLLVLFSLPSLQLGLGDRWRANGATASCSVSKIASASFSHFDIRSLGLIGHEIVYWNPHSLTFLCVPEPHPLSDVSRLPIFMYSTSFLTESARLQYENLHRKKPPLGWSKHPASHRERSPCSTFSIHFQLWMVPSFTGWKPEWQLSKAVNPNRSQGSSSHACWYGGTRDVTLWP